MDEVVDGFRKILREKDVSVTQSQVGVVLLERDVATFLVLVIKLLAKFKWDNLQKVLLGIAVMFCEWTS